MKKVSLVKGLLHLNNWQQLKRQPEGRGNPQIAGPMQRPMPKMVVQQRFRSRLQWAKKRFNKKLLVETILSNNQVYRIRLEPEIISGSFFCQEGAVFLR
jgi:hypothetical protein